MAKKLLLGVAIAAAVGIGYFSVNGWPRTAGTGTEGTVQAAKHSRSEQIKTSDVELQNPEVQAFLQTDFFHKLVTDKAFQRLVANGTMQKVAELGVDRAAGVVEVLDNRVVYGDKAGLANKVELSDKAGLANKVELSDKAGLANKVELSDKAGLANKVELSDKAGLANKVELSDKAVLDLVATLDRGAVSDLVSLDRGALVAALGNKVFLNMVKSSEFQNAAATGDMSKFEVAE